MRREHTAHAELGSNFILAEEALDAFIELAGDAAAAADHLAEVPVALAAIAESLAMILDQLNQMCIGQERLGRDAAPVQADPAQLVALDAEDPLFELCCANGPGISGRSATNHHDVIVVCHGVL